MGAVGQNGAGGGGRNGRAKNGKAGGNGYVDALCGGRKPESPAVPPLAKGMSEEMDKSMFWDGPIV